MKRGAVELMLLGLHLRSLRLQLQPCRVQIYSATSIVVKGWARLRSCQQPHCHGPSCA